MGLSGYQFGRDDYEAHVRHRAQLLTSPRGRAALLRSGVIARIAREYIAIDSALFGPSSAVTVHRLGMHIADRGLEFWDDDLTENATGIICSVYRSSQVCPLRIRHKVNDNNNLFFRQGWSNCIQFLVADANSLGE
jgi:hypothetical protein